MNADGFQLLFIQSQQFGCQTGSIFSEVSGYAVFDGDFYWHSFVLVLLNYIKMKSPIAVDRSDISSVLLFRIYSDLYIENGLILVWYYLYYKNEANLCCYFGDNPCG